MILVMGITKEVMEIATKLKEILTETIVILNKETKIHIKPILISSNTKVLLNKLKKNE